MKNEKLNIESTGFKTPKGYFDDLEDQLMKRINSDKTLEAIEDSGFAVPKDYFETIDSEIFSKLEDEKPVIFLHKKWYYIAGVAASLVVFLGLIFNTNTVTFNDVSTIEIENYINEQNIENEELAVILDLDAISETDFIEYNISDDEVYEYLDTEDNTELDLFIN